MSKQWNRFYKACNDMHKKMPNIINKLNKVNVEYQSDNSSNANKASFGDESYVATPKIGEFIATPKNNP